MGYGQTIDVVLSVVLQREDDEAGFLVHLMRSLDNGLIVGA